MVYDLLQNDDFNALGNNPALWDPYRAPGSVQGGIASRQEFLGTFWPWFKAATLLLKVYGRRISVLIGTVVQKLFTVGGTACVVWPTSERQACYVLYCRSFPGVSLTKKRFRHGGAAFSLKVAPRLKTR